MPDRPTKAELKAKEEQLIAEAEEAKKNHKPDEEEEPTPPEPKEEEFPDPEATPTTPEVEEEVIVEPAPEEEEVEEAPPVEEKPVEPDLKKKLSASARENQKISAKNRVINKAMEDADDMPEPTDEELVAMPEYKDAWDVMSDIEKDMAREIVASRRYRAKVKEAREQGKKIEKWNDDVAEFIEDPRTLIAYPDLEGKRKRFAKYATLEENNNIPFEKLVKSFLFDQAGKATKSKGKMFAHASGGPNSKPKQSGPKKLTLEESRKLRETNYDMWKAYNKANLISFEI